MVAKSPIPTPSSPQSLLDKEFKKLKDKGAAEVSKIQKSLSPNSSPDVPTTEQKAFLSRESSSILTNLSDDFFIQWESLRKSDYSRSYLYELFVVDTEKNNIVYSYTFPINPAAITINVPSASTVEATMKGIIVTENGAPFRQISISGTTGTVPISPIVAKKDAPSETSKTLDYLFKNTIKAVNQFKAIREKAIAASTGSVQRFSGPLNHSILDIPITGYESIHDLARFLDVYLAIKKQARARSYRLVLAMHKDNMYYKCKLDNYSISKRAGTLEYDYSISLTAFQRMPNLQMLKGTISTMSKSLSQSRNSISAINAAFNAVKAASAQIAAARNILRGIRSDIDDSIITPLSDMKAALKEVLGAAYDAYDFYKNGGTQFQNAVQQAISMGEDFTADKIENQDVIGGTDNMSREARQDQDLKNSENTAHTEDMRTPSASPTNAIRNDPLAFYGLLTSIPLDSLDLTDETLELIEAKKDAIRQMTSAEVLRRRNVIADYIKSISEAFGGGSVTYNRMMDTESPSKIYKKLTVDDVILLSQLNDIVLAFDSVAAQMQEAEKNAEQDYYKFYQDYAIAAGIPFNTSSSRFFVPFPYEGTLEQLALQYLGDPDRWVEIAAVNSLKSPYVDEIGTEIPVVASSGGNTLTVSTDLNLFVGQIVQISSSAQKVIRRKIRTIDVFSAVETIVTFEEVNDGIALSSYKTSENAVMRIYAPNTINSNMLIAIPSSMPSNFSNIKTSPEISQLNGLARMAKIDMLLDSTGDMIILGGGDVKLAYGMTNIIQAAMLKLKTKAGTMIQHSSFGNNLSAGTPSAEVDVAAVIQDLDSSFRDDPRFSGIMGAEVKKEGPALTLSVLVGLASSDVVLPISAQIPV